MTCSSTGSPAACRSTPRNPEPEAGFTLIELLVSFAIAALVLGALYRVYSTGLNATLSGQHYSDAVLIAQSTLDELSATRPGSTDDTVGIYHRSWNIVNRPDLLPAGSQVQAMPYEIDVTVAWQTGSHQREVSLSVLRLAASQP